MAYWSFSEIQSSADQKKMSWGIQHHILHRGDWVRTNILCGPPLARPASETCAFLFCLFGIWLLHILETCVALSILMQNDRLD